MSIEAKTLYDLDAGNFTRENGRLSGPGIVMLKGRLLYGNKYEGPSQKRGSPQLGIGALLASLAAAQWAVERPDSIQ